MRIEQLRETGEARPDLHPANFDGVTRADALRELLIKHDFEIARSKDVESAKHGAFVVAALCALVCVGVGMAFAQSPQQRAADILRNGPGVSQWRGGVFDPAGPTVASTPSAPAQSVAPRWSQQERELERFNENATNLQLIGDPNANDQSVYDGARSTRRATHDHTGRHRHR